MSAPTEVRYGKWVGDIEGRWRHVLGGWVCGKHFCEECGDCIACYADLNDEHPCFAVQYEYELEEDDSERTDRA